MSKRCLLVGSLWLATGCNLYDEGLLPAHELWSARDRDAGQSSEQQDGIDDLKPRVPAPSFDAGASAAGSGGHQLPEDSGQLADAPASDGGGAAARADSGSGGTCPEAGCAGSAAAGSGGDAGLDDSAASDGGGGSAAGGGGGVSGNSAAGSGGTGATGGNSAAGSGSSGGGTGGNSAAGSGGGGGGGGGASGNSAAGSGSSGGTGAAGSGADPNCPESGGKTWSSNGHCYFPLTAQASWNVSRDSCTQKSAKLVSITSAEELSFVAGLLGSTPSWIGLSKFGAPAFSWSTGEALSYTNWAAAEPNLSGEAAAAMRNDTHQWFDDAVSATHAAICERP